MAKAGFITVDGDGPFPTKFDDCEHDDPQVDWPDPSVGIFGTAVWCDECGATAEEITEEEDPDGRSWYVADKHWIAPEYKEEVSA